ncbi:MAG: glycosyltransferase [Patescibacteria group bacterium]
MMKVLYILTKSGIGGAQKYAKDLAENLDKNKFEAKILYGKQDIEWLSNKTYPWFLFINDWLAVLELVKIFKKEQPDIAHLNSSKAGVIGALAGILSGKKRPKIVFTAHGWIFNHTNELNWFVRNFYIFLHKISSLFIDKIICVSGYDYNLALEYNICEPEKLATIHNGISANIKFLGKKEAKKQLSEKLITYLPVRSLAKEGNLKLKTNIPWVGSIGRLVKEKNYETFIEAARLVPNTYFFIIGEGPELEKLKVLSSKLKVNDRFFIIPPGGNDARYLKTFDVFVMSSIKEGLPYILLEAMAAELPIVITEAGGMPELIKNHENGLMVAQRNPEALARAIGGLIENSVVAKELAKRAKEIATEKFSLKKMVAETEKEYFLINTNN